MMDKDVLVYLLEQIKDTLWPDLMFHFFPRNGKLW